MRLKTARTALIVLALLFFFWLIFVRGAHAYNPADLAPTSVCHIGGKTQMLCLHNWTRKQHGLKPLSQSSTLYWVAGQKADRILFCGVFTHTPCGDPAFQFMPTGFCGACGENLAYGYSTVRMTYAAWLNSPGHLANILNPNVTLYGSGFRVTTPFPYLWAVELARPLSVFPAKGGFNAGVR